jgi:hypothetical protein
LRERFRHKDARRDYAATSASARPHRWNVTHNLTLGEICTPLSRLNCRPALQDRTRMRIDRRTSRQLQVDHRRSLHTVYNCQYVAFLGIPPAMEAEIDLQVAL